MKKKREKKKGVEPEMGYCPFEHWLGTKTGVGARRRRHATLGRGTTTRRLGAGHARRRRARKQAGRTSAGRAGAGRALGRAGGTGAGARGVGARGHSSRRGARATRRLGRGLGMLLGQQVVHSLHSACFDPVSTWYCS